MNAFHKKIVLVLLPLYNSFLKIELNCDKENHVNFKYMQLSKENAV